METSIIAIIVIVIVVIIIVIILALSGSTATTNTTPTYQPSGQDQSQSQYSSYPQNSGGQNTAPNNYSSSSSNNSYSNPAVNSGNYSQAAQRPRRQPITDPGYNDSPGNLVRGWYDMQNHGVSDDYCSYTGDKISPNNWSCALAGSSGYKPYSEASSPAPRLPGAAPAPPPPPPPSGAHSKQAIKVGGSNKCADVTGGTKDDVWLQIYECGDNNISQQWTYDPNAPNQPIISALNNKCMDYDASTTRINTRTCNGGNTQRWHYIDGPNGGKQFQSDANSGVCLNAQGGGLKQGDRLIGYYCGDGGPNSQWAWS